MRLGCVKYLNARPLIHGWRGPVEFDHPARLCERLARGDLDVALVSSSEFLRNPIYKIVNDVAIGAAGPVYSVVVAHRGDFAALPEIELDPASQSSVNLLRCLVAELKLAPRLVARATDSHAGRLLIGDQAIRFRGEHGAEFEYWDLGEQWARIVDLPFIFALWLIRPEFPDAQSVASELRRLRDNNMTNLKELIAGENRFDRAFCRRYFTEHLRFGFGEREQEGFAQFARRCAGLELSALHDPRSAIRECLV